MWTHLIYIASLLDSLHAFSSCLQPWTLALTSPCQTAITACRIKSLSVRNFLTSWWLPVQLISYSLVVIVSCIDDLLGLMLRHEVLLGLVGLTQMHAFKGIIMSGHHQVSMRTLTLSMMYWQHNLLVSLVDLVCLPMSKWIQVCQPGLVAHICICSSF